MKNQAYYYSEYVKLWLSSMGSTDVYVEQITKPSGSNTFFKSQVCCDRKHLTLISPAVIYLEGEPCLKL